jgi:signal transduction histidine kinase
MLDRKENGEERKKLIYAGKMHLIHWLIVLLSVLLTFGAWYYSKSQFNQKLEDKFQRNADQVVNLVKERMQLYENALWGAVAYIDADETDMTHTKWLAYSNSLKIDLAYPGINGIGVIHNIQTDQLDDYIEKQRMFRPNYAIHPSHNESEYWPITYVEPVVSNKKAIGLDMAFETNRYTSIKKARDTGNAQLTGPITLVQDAKKTPGFLFYTPFYKDGTKPESTKARRDSIVGVTYAPFIMKNLMQGTLAEQNRHVSFQIYDAGDMLFDDHADKSTLDVDVNPLFTKEQDIAFYGRIWSFSIQSNLDFREESAANQSSFILVGGLVIDALLLGLFLFLSRANRQALAYADQMTHALEEKTIHLEKSNSDLEQFSYVASHDLKSPLNAIKQLVGWITEDCQEIIPDESKKHLALLAQRSDRMMKLLNDLLDYSRINRSEFKSELVNLNEMSTDILDLLDKPPGFTISAPDTEIMVPRAPFEIVLRNLISNSIKHHDKESGHVNILCKNVPNYQEVTVEDDGPGIPEKFHDKVMEMFQTLKSRDKVEGSGMGLAMIKRVIEHYQGNISIDSDGQRGTKVIIHWQNNKNSIISN